ncbi:SDR family NAD(P)-dependent oxidoreductase [Streptomyces sp. NPDC096310]|uniref:SDR family NAD(P)-dependent oxidoreductase n=1 Tax=Streptomyces sp. NPDC096310 TaxID=3366082 RepID=UPI0038020328
MTTSQASAEDGDLTGVRALVTGGTWGVGAATVRRFLAGGARVVAVARHAAAVPPGAHLVIADLTTSTGALGAAERAMHLLGGIDVLVNNAGGDETPSGAPPRQAHPELNLMAAARLDQQVVPLMTAQGHGSVIHVSSGGTHGPAAPDALPRTDVGVALNVYSKGLAHAVGPLGVRVMAVLPDAPEPSPATPAATTDEAANHPGPTLTAFRVYLHAHPSDPLEHPGGGEEAAELIAFLASRRDHRGATGE